MIQNEPTNVDVYKLLHDLRGPLINVRGFHGEIQNALAELRTTLEKNASSVPTELFQQLMKLMNDDLQPCGQLMDKAVQQLHARLDKVSDS